MRHAFICVQKSCCVARSWSLTGVAMVIRTEGTRHVTQSQDISGKSVFDLIFLTSPATVSSIARWETKQTWLESDLQLRHRSIFVIHYPILGSVSEEIIITPDTYAREGALPRR